MRVILLSDYCIKTRTSFNSYEPGSPCSVFSCFIQLYFFHFIEQINDDDDDDDDLYVYLLLFSCVLTTYNKQP